MERESDLNVPPQGSKKHPTIRLSETPPINGSKPVGPLKIDEQCKKHIRRDGIR